MKAKKGLELESLLGMIAKEKKPTNFKDDKYPYYEYCEYYESLCNVFGRDGFEAEYELGESVVLPNGQMFLTVVCRIHILGEDEKRIFTVMGVGTKEVTYQEKNNLYIGINNLGLMAQQAAFKSACRELNIFNCIYAEEGQVKKPSANAKKEKGTDVVEKELYVSGGLEVVRDDAKSGLPVYRLAAQEIIGNSMRTEKLEVVFYPSSYNNEFMAAAWKDFIDKAGVRPMRRIMKLKPVNGKENSYVFKAF